MGAWCDAARTRLVCLLGVGLLLAIPACARAQQSSPDIPNRRGEAGQTRSQQAEDRVRRSPRREARPAPAGLESACRGEPAAAGEVRSVIDGRSFVLADGREIRLAGIEVPLLPARRSGAGERADSELRWAEATRRALAEMIADRSVDVRRVPEGVDRYGRVLAFGELAGAGAPSIAQSIAHVMLARGFARVAAQVGDLSCAAELWRQERTAREGKLGLWSEAYYAVRGADDSDGLAADLGHFVVVEGRVASVRESGGTLYVNFGRQWSRALTVTISRRNERILAAAGLEPRQLEGRRVRVRGFLEERSGPRIEAARAEQIEIAER